MNIPPRNLCEARAEIIKALAHPSRILIADLLSQGEMCVCEITPIVDADVSTVSKHLSVMKNAGIVKVQKRGQNQYYSLKCSCLPEFITCVDMIARTRLEEAQAAFNA